MIGKVWVEEYAFSATALLGEINRIFKIIFVIHIFSPLQFS